MSDFSGNAFISDENNEEIRDKETNLSLQIITLFILTTHVIGLKLNFARGKISGSKF